MPRTEEGGQEVAPVGAVGGLEANAAGDSSETEAVLATIFVTRFEQENNTGQMPDNIDATASNASERARKMGHKLGEIGDIIEREHGDTIDREVKKFVEFGDCTFERFCEVARHILTNNYNWGRIMTLIFFGYRVAVHSVTDHTADFIKKIFKMLVQFFLTDRLTNWIAEHGGWERAIQVVIENTSFPTQVFIAGVVAVAAITFFVWMRTKSS